MVRVCWDWVIRITGWLAGIGAVLLMLPTVADVSYRKLFGPSLPGMIEVSEVGIVLIAYLAMATAMRRGAHIGTPIMTSRLNPILSRRLRLIGQGIVWIALALMVWGSARVGLESFAVREFRFGLIQFPIWPAKLAVPIGLLLMLIELTVQMADSAAGREAGKIGQDG